MIDSSLQLLGYQNLDLIHEGYKSLVYRAQRICDQKAVILKFLRNKYPSFKELLQFRNQYTITKNLKIDGVVRPMALENYRNSLVLVMADGGDVSLAEYINRQPLNLEQFLKIAISLTQILAELYQHRIIHKDIKPQNILIHPNTLEVKLIDFSIASLLPKETRTIQNPNALEGTLTYLSPEQTGRMNRGIDYRTDFYSLGVTFYELLTGKLPFQSDDPMELVHCHIARKPIPPIEVNPNLPEVLSNIVMKLMAKMAEERYQSARGLEWDLQVCQQQLKKYQKIERFEIAQKDLSDRFVLSEKLYGREQEVATLLAAFDRVIGYEGAENFGRLSQREILLVRGFSGIGKTAVVNEVHKPIVRQKGYFIKGKFEQFQRNIPFSAFVQAFRDLMRQLLSESETQLQGWKEKILSALGENGQILIGVIPELEDIIGQQPSVTELLGTAAQNRFNLLLKRFIQVLSSKEHPLVLFLDDLQWADSASLKLIQLLMSETDSQYLLVIGAYRDHEVSSVHPLILTLNELAKQGVLVNTITLEPLQLDDVKYLIADTLHCSPQQAIPLAELVMQKTRGNPFFATQFLKALHQEELITFNDKVGYWQCDLVKIRALSLTENVVDLVRDKLRKLPQKTQYILQLAACIGNEFNLKTLSIVCEKCPLEIAENLWIALEEGLILPTSEVYHFFPSSEPFISEDFQAFLKSEEKPFEISYKFLHDRIQQAAYYLIPEDEKSAIHLKIGQLLLNNLRERDENIFDVVNQLNLGKDLLTTQAEQHQLAKLNGIAGQKAKLSTAYDAALEYFQVGIELTKTWDWQDYQLSLNLYTSAAEAASLLGEFEQMQRWITVVLQQAKVFLDTIKVYQVKILAHIAQNQMLEAVQTGLQVLEKLGIRLSENPTSEDVAQSLATIQAALAKTPISDLIDLKLMNNPTQQAAINILSKIATPAYVVSSTLYSLIIFQQVNLSLQFGNSPESTFGYASYGMILSAGMGDVDSGYQMGQLALNLIEKLNAYKFKARASVVIYGLINPWIEPLNSTLSPLLNGYSKGLETGELEFASYCAFLYCYHRYCLGEELNALQQEITNYSQAIAEIKQEQTLYKNQVFHQAVLNLLGESENPCILKGTAYNEDLMISVHQDAKNRDMLYYISCNKLILCYLFGDVERALENAEFAYQYVENFKGLFLVILLYFYESLALLSGAETLSPNQLEFNLKKVEENQQKIKQFVKNAPDNFLNKFYLVEAERYRVLDEKLAAIEMYESAIAEAKKQGFIQEESLANELAAKFYLSWNKEKIAQTYMIEAYYAYSRWGAQAKVEDLEKRYPLLLDSILEQKKINLNPDKTLIHLSETSLFAEKNLQTLTAHRTNISEALDLKTVMKASQVLSGEIKLDKLLSVLMQVMMENAGASRGCLVRLLENKLTIQAQCEINQDCNLYPILIEEKPLIPMTLVHYVWRTKKFIVINHVKNETRFTADPYIILHQPQSILCTPIINHGQLIGILYLENSLTCEAFTPDRIRILQLLCSQAAISLENAELYQKSQDYARQLEGYIQDLKTAQLEIIKSKKMSELGHLMAGIAHEINNPVGFISGNISYAEEYIQDLIEHLQLYQKKFSEPDEEIDLHADEIDLNYILEDLPDLISSMKTGVERIRNISSSMRIFYRADKDCQVAFNIHEGIDSTLLILKYRLKANEKRSQIEVIKQYANLPKIFCFPGQLNQVFMNLIANAIDAFDEASEQLTPKPHLVTSHQIKIQTEINAEEHMICIKIKDNGPGISPEVKHKIFNHLFTTKPVGQGTGLGLSISRQIIEERHQGRIQCHSEIGKGTEFIIEIPLKIAEIH
ncbi:AAA family ATPase [Capilliphycus salinus ALCB114379]|uniref:trifunctional serine/threonine-protein kinase/ATP-binding protein/sensor histidine kinase n=1 Tax=Capilliphycus salinus TaxID=2768948 RepID=UPI0039A531F1